ncbi:MAG TPA: tape measure protein [Vitreimonas sp.]|nr:tape measure protein [Vitreimonas sp.]
MSMSFDLGSVVARVSADISNFKEGITEAKGHLSSFGDKLGTVTSSISDFSNKAAVFTTVVGAGFSLLAKETIATAANFEQTGIAFSTMVGDAEKAKDLLKEISKFSRETPFELEQVLEGSKRLLAYNVAAKDVIPTMEMLGNISSGVGRDKLPQLILAFGQVKAATKLTGAELRQFSEAGVPLLQALVDEANKGGGMLVKVGDSSKKAKVDVGELNDKLGIAKKRLEEATKAGKAKESTMMSLKNTVQNYEQKIGSATAATAAAGTGFKRVKVSAAEMIAAVSDGQVKFEDVQKALSGMTAKGGKFFDLMKRQNSTLPVALSNIKQSFQELFTTILGVSVTGEVADGSIFQKLTVAALDFMNFIESARPQITAMVQGAIAEAGAFFVGLYNTLKPIGEWITANQQTVITFLQGLGIALGVLLSVGTITLLLAALLNPLVLVSLGIAALYTAWQTNFLGIQTITQQVADFLKFVFENFILPIFNSFIAWLNEVFLPAFNVVFNGVLVPLFNSFVGWFKDRWTFITSMIDGAWKIISGIILIAWNTISGFLTAGLQLLAGNWKGAFETLVNITVNNSEAIKRIFSGIVEFVKGWGGTFYNELVKPFQDAWNKIQELIDKIKDKVDLTKRHSPSVLDIVKNGVSKVNKALGELSVSTNLEPRIAGAAISNSASTNMTHVTVSLDGAMIGDEFSAMRMAETIGNGIIKKLGQNVRY